MSSSYTTLLGFVLPVTGELANTWGSTVNNSLTQLVEDSIAGYSTQSVTSGDWTLTTTAGGVSNQARTMILIATGAPGTTRYIYAPQQSKTYVVINNCSDLSKVFISGGTSGSHTTGVSIPAGSSAVVAWDSTVSDFVKIAGGGGGGATGGGTDQIFYQNGLNVTTDYTITTNNNAGTFGPVSVNAGVTVTVPDGSVWTVV
jgi:hypothetical protein